MREVQVASFRCFQFELPGRASYKRHGADAPLATSSAYSLLNVRGTKTSLKSRTTSHINSTSHPSHSHSCVSVNNTIKCKDSKQILVGSALRRPHATGFSPLDYQTMPDVGKAPKQPYRSQSACTVYRYANRPLSAVQAGKQHGKHTKSSLLRNKSTSCDSIASRSSCCSSSEDGSRPNSANKRLCEIRDDYRFFKRGPTAKQVPPHGQSLHSFLTGARYNNSRLLDSRTLSKLGVYIPKERLNTFFVKEERPRETDPDNEDEGYVEYHLNMSETQDEVSIQDEDIHTQDTEDKAVNTDSNFMSLQRWHSAEWKTDRKPTTDKAPRAHTAPTRFKPVTTLYHDYNTGKKYQYGDNS